MTDRARLVSVGVLLVAAFAAGVLAARALDRAAAEGADAAVDERAPGLQVAQDGYRMVLARSRFGSEARREPLSFRILDISGKPIRDFEVAHDKRMHFIVVRRDLTGFQHLHPTMGSDGTWTTDVDLGAAGVYRVFADFTRGRENVTLGADVHVGGDYRPSALPAAASTARTEENLTVRLESPPPRSGDEATLAFEVREDGRRVNDDLEPYLGAKGHLVALRARDLAYLHNHPEDDELAFMSTYPSAGDYRLFVQFSYEGRVHTAALTQEIAR